jgi:hypothetical protein
MIRNETKHFCDLGPLPGTSNPDLSRLKDIEMALHAITPPVSDEEAKLLVAQFGPDDCFGLAWALLHLIETSPNWPIAECLGSPTTEWVLRLRKRAERKNT